MSNDMNMFLEKFSAAERNSGTMTTFQSLPKEEQVALLEWSRATCMQIGVFVEKQTATSQSGKGDGGTLPVPKFHAEIAIKIGVIHALARENTELLQGCEAAYKHVFGDQKFKTLEDFKRTVTLILQLSRW